MSVNPVVTWWVVLLLMLAGLGLTGWLAWRAHRDERVAAWVRVGIVALLGVLLLRPGAGVSTEAAAANDLEVLVVVDKTYSMAATDAGAGRSRIAAARADLADIASELNGARFALLSVGRIVNVDLPWSRDTDAFTAAATGLELESPLDGAGSSMDRAQGKMDQLLGRAQEQRPDRRRIVLFLSDGEVTETDAEQTSFGPIADLVQGGAVIGYGSEVGGQMPLPSQYGGGVITQKGGAPAVSRMDQDNLERIADQLDVEFIHSDKTGLVKESVASIQRNVRAGEGRTRARYDLTWVVAILLGGLTLLELRRAAVERSIVRAEVPR